MNSKKAMIEAQFNWIFILIVGSIILVFFVFVAKTYMNAADIKQAHKSLQHIDSIVKGAAALDKAYSKHEIPGKRLTFTCSPECTNIGCASDYSFMALGVSQQSPTDIIFAPTSIKSDFLVTWTLDWSIPFKVASFLYLTQPGIKYVVVGSGDGNTDFAQNVLNLLTENEFIDVEQSLVDVSNGVSSMSDVKKGSAWTRFVVVNVGNIEVVIPHIQQILEKKQDAVIISPIQGFDYGNVNYVTRETSSGQFHYYGKESLLGAIFSGNEEIFECNMNKAFLRLNKVFEIYKKRLETLNEEVQTVLPMCSALYDQQSLPIPYPFSYPLSSIDSLSSLKSNIELKNRQAIVSSCPRLY